MNIYAHYMERVGMFYQIADSDFTREIRITLQALRVLV